MQLSLEDVQDIKVAEDLVLDESERSSLEALIKTFRIPDKRVKGIYSFTYKGLHKKEMLERLRFVWEIESVLASPLITLLIVPALILASIYLF